MNFKKCTVHVLAITLSFISVQSFAQSKETKKAIKNANKFYYDDNFKSAAALFQSVVKEMKDDADINYKLGYSYLHTNKKKKALPYLEQAYRLDPEIDDKVMLSLAKAYHLNHKFDEASTLR